MRYSLVILSFLDREYRTQSAFLVNPPRSVDKSRAERGVSA